MKASLSLLISFLTALTGQNFDNSTDEAAVYEQFQQAILQESACKVRYAICEIGNSKTILEDIKEALGNNIKAFKDLGYSYDEAIIAGFEINDIYRTYRYELYCFCFSHHDMNTNFKYMENFAIYMINKQQIPKQTILQLLISTILSKSPSLYKFRNGVTFEHAIEAELPPELIEILFDTNDIINATLRKNESYVQDNILRHFHDHKYLDLNKFLNMICKIYVNQFHEELNSSSNNFEQLSGEEKLQQLTNRLLRDLKNENSNIYIFKELKIYILSNIYHNKLITLKDLVKNFNANEVFQVLLGYSIDTLNEDKYNELHPQQREDLMNITNCIATDLDFNIEKFKKMGYSYINAAMAGFKYEQIINTYNIKDEITKENIIRIFSTHSIGQQNIIESFNIKTKSDLEKFFFINDFVENAKQYEDKNELLDNMRKILCNNDLDEFKKNGFSAEEAYALNFNGFEIINTYNLEPSAEEGLPYTIICDFINETMINEDECFQNFDIEAIQGFRFPMIQSYISHSGKFDNIIFKEIIDNLVNNKYKNSSNINIYKSLKAIIKRIYRNKVDQFKSEKFNITAAILFFDYKDVKKHYEIHNIKVEKFIPILFNLNIINEKLPSFLDILEDNVDNINDDIPLYKRPDRMRSIFYLINHNNLNLSNNNNILLYPNKTLFYSENNDDHYDKNYCKDYYKLVYNKVKECFNNDINEFKKCGYNVNEALFAGFDIVDIFKTYQQDTFTLFNEAINQYRKTEKDNYIDPKCQQIIEIVNKITKGNIKNLVFYGLSPNGLMHYFANSTNADQLSKYKNQYQTSLKEYNDILNSILKHAYEKHLLMINKYNEYVRVMDTYNSELYNTAAYGNYINEHFREDLTNFLKYFSININNSFFDSLNPCKWITGEIPTDELMHKQIEYLDEHNIISKPSENLNEKHSFLEYIDTPYVRGGPKRYDTLNEEQKNMLRIQINYLNKLTLDLEKLTPKEQNAENIVATKNLYGKILDLYNTVHGFCGERLAAVISNSTPLFNLIEFLSNNPTEQGLNENTLVNQFLQVYRTRVFDNLKTRISYNNVHIMDSLDNRFADLFAVPYIKSNEEPYTPNNNLYLYNIYKNFKFAFESINFNGIIEELGSTWQSCFYNEVKIRSSKVTLDSLNIDSNKCLDSLLYLEQNCNNLELKDSFIYIKKWFNEHELEVTISDLGSHLLDLHEIIENTENLYDDKTVSNAKTVYNNLEILLLPQKMLVPKILNIYLKDKYGINLPN